MPKILRRSNLQPDSGVRPGTATEAIDLLTVREVARLLRLPRKSVYDLVARQRIAVIRLGRSLRFARADVIALLDRNRAAVGGVR